VDAQPKEEEVKQDWRKLRNEKRNNFCFNYIVSW
jgi:hypothetical protein